MHNIQYLSSFTILYSIVSALLSTKLDVSIHVAILCCLPRPLPRVLSEHCPWRRSARQALTWSDLMSSKAWQMVMFQWVKLMPPASPNYDESWPIFCLVTQLSELASCSKAPGSCQIPAQVIGEGPLRGLNASALLMSRIRRWKPQQETDLLALLCLAECHHFFIHVNLLFGEFVDLLVQGAGISISSSPPVQHPELSEPSEPSSGSYAAFLACSTCLRMGHGGMNPHLSGKIAL